MKYRLEFSLDYLEHDYAEVTNAGLRKLQEIAAESGERGLLDYIFRALRWMVDPDEVFGGDHQPAPHPFFVSFGGGGLDRLEVYQAEDDEFVECYESYELEGLGRVRSKTDALKEYCTGNGPRVIIGYLDCVDDAVLTAEIETKGEFDLSKLKLFDSSAFKAKTCDTQYCIDPFSFKYGSKTYTMDEDGDFYPNNLFGIFVDAKGKRDFSNITGDESLTDFIDRMIQKLDKNPDMVLKTCPEDSPTITLSVSFDNIDQ